ncbi:MAG: trypsin-like peptidase domain-containing protein [Oscillospiraceae bacterium]|nr:trypsin-like peptidase domain-containing protein [Oscillospiraceae bacterium]
MYQDNNNNNNDRSQYEYHYNFRPNYSDPITVEPVVECEVKPRRSRIKKVIAGVLCTTLLIGGSFGAGWITKKAVDENKVNSTQFMVSERPKTEVTTVNVTGNQKLSYPEIYAANVNSCVSINVSSTSYNYFGQTVQSASSGSGFIITQDGYIVTNYHVISGGTNVKVTLNDGTTYDAEVIGGEKDYDIAVLKVDPGETKLQCVVLGQSENLLVGDEIFTIGNPLGELTFSMSEGIVSCLNREINVDGTPFNMIQITAAVNSGNSGGPLFNTYGEVVGIVSAKYSSSSSGASVEGLGFAIPMDDVLSMIRDIMENGQITTRPYLGIMAAYDSQPSLTGIKSGVYIESVFEDGPAANAGLRAGDVITMIGVATINNRDDISSLSKSYQAGDTVTVTYVREKQVYTTSLTFGSTTDAQPETTAQQQTQQGQQPNQPTYPNPYGNMQDFFEYYFGNGQFPRGNAA